MTERRWFKHRHWWRVKTGLNTLIDPKTGKAMAGLIVEDCACGAVRTIEFMFGEAPVVREAPPPVHGEARHG